MTYEIEYIKQLRDDLKIQLNEGLLTQDEYVNQELLLNGIILHLVVRQKDINALKSLSE